MEKLSLHAPGSSEDFSKITYRVRGIPHELDRESARTLLSALLKAEVLSVDSLAKSLDRKNEKVATIRLSGRSAKLDGDRTEWRIPATGLEGSSRKHLLVDTHFEGFTPLHDPIGSSDDASEYLYLLLLRTRS